MSNQAHDRPAPRRWVSMFDGWDAFGYARISLDPDDIEAGVGRQQDDNVGWGGRNGVRLRPDVEGGTPQFVDNDRSASDKAKKPRKAYLRLLRALEDQPEVRLIVCWVLDRFLRRNDELEDLFKLARRRGGLWLATESKAYDLCDDDDKHVLTMLVAGARRESAMISKRTKRQRLSLRAAGKLPHGVVYGWTPDGQAPLPGEADTVVEMVERILTGLSLLAVAAWLNDGGVPTRLAASYVRRGRPAPRWSGPSVRSVVTTPRHYGHFSFLEEVQEGKPREYRILERDHHAPLEGLTGEMYEQVLATLANNRGLPRRSSRRSLLTGLVLCGLCGNPLTRGVAHRGTPTLRCQRRTDRPQWCGKIAIDAAAVEEYVTGWTFNWVDRGKLGSLVKGRAARSDAGALEARLAELDRQEDADVAAEDAGTMSKSRADKKDALRTAERERVRGELARLASSRVLRPYFGKPGALKADWTTLDPDVRREMIAEALRAAKHEVRIRPGRPARNAAGFAVVDTRRIQIRPVAARDRRVA